ncbi:MAG: hypothetical protein HYY13_05960 [Nitrospirae bacterium]|nr:hypothetical protein [Nitrospirota bacterium]
MAPRRRPPLALLALAVLLLLPGGLLVANPAFIRMTRLEEADEPVARFPHWTHQEGFKCYACHPSLFSMTRKTGFTHEDMGEGRFCGACHDGQTAFHHDQDEDHECEECHVE